MAPDDVFRIVGTVQAGAYRVDGVVAEGGFAVVYRAYHEAFRAAVALKCLKIPGTLSQSHQAEFLERFREEAELLFRLSASIPAVVRPLHVGTLDTPIGAFVPFLALEWLDGRTLDRHIAERREAGRPPMSLEAVLRLLTPVADALERAHHFPASEGEIAILHRDLKPENVVVARIHGVETAKILDFGIGTVKSAATQIVGKQSAGEQTLSAFTPGYGAPEQWLPKRFGQTGRWTDVWGLAITVVEALLGHPPFEGDHAAMMGGAIDEKRRPTPREEGIEVNDAVEAAFRKALAVDPKSRYHEVADFWRDLHAGLGLSIVRTSLHPPRSGAGARSPAAVLSSPPDPHAGTQPMAPPVAAARIPTLVVAPRRAAAPTARSETASAGKGPIDLARDEERPISSGAPSYLLGSTLDDLDDLDDGAVGRAPVQLGGLDGIGLSPGPAVPISRPRPAEGARLVTRVQRRAGTAAVRDRFRGPVKLVLLGVVLMVADFAYAELAGETAAFGPLRPVMIAGPLVIVGVGLGVLRLFGAGPE